jgi:hypothetical protein
MAALPIDLDRAARTPLAMQIYRAVRDAIETGWHFPDMPLAFGDICSSG